MSELIRFWNFDINEMSAEEIEQELRCQKKLRSTIVTELNLMKRKEQTGQRIIQARMNQIDLFEMYVKELDGLIAELEHRQKHVKDKSRRTYLTRAKNRTFDENYFASTNNGISWDRDKFMTLANDRGYLSERSITAAISEELEMPLDRTKTLLKHGKFTWGQVMCLGALLKMNPKEFCDIFMSGYFTEYYGEYIASYKNLDKSQLLKRATE